MTSNDPRVERNTESVIALRDLLRIIVSEPENFADNEQIITALKSQGKTASLDLEISFNGTDHKITPVSLNTLKTYSNELFDNGFEGLNQLRTAALDSIKSFNERKTKSNKRTKTGLQMRVRELEDELEKHKQVNFILLQALSSSISSIKGIKNAPSKDLLEKRADEAISRLRAIISMNPQPFDQLKDTNTVVRLGKNEKQ